MIFDMKISDMSLRRPRNENVSCSRVSRLEKNWRRKEMKMAYSVQAIDLIGAP
jgi:hypothetical protein